MDDGDLRESLDEAPLMRLVPLAGHVVSQRFGRLMGRQHGLSPGGAAVLSVLAWGTGRGVEKGTPGRATHAELARRCLIAPGTLTGVIDTLERAGYVSRKRDDTDRRVVWLAVTEAGRQRVSEIGKQIGELWRPTMVTLDPATEKTVRAFLTDLIVTYHEKEEQA